MKLFGKGRQGQSRGSDRGPLVADAGSVAYGPGHKESDMFGDRGHGDDATQVATSLGKGSQITGKLTFEGTVRIDGAVEGEIAAQESVVIGESAKVKAQLTADSVIITGEVTGDIIARRRVEIRAPGKLYGNITTPSLVIHDGVVFEGRCSMGANDAGAKARSVEVLSQKDDRAEEPASLTVEREAGWSTSH